MYFRPKIVVPKGLIQKLTQEQNLLREKIILSPLKKQLKTIAGCDSSLIGENIFSIFVVFSYPDLSELEVAHSTSKLPLPYIPGFLAFREIPNLQKAYKKLKIKPDIIMVDGHGIMHPRRMGIATHLGIKLNKPTFGVAKKKLVGKFNEPGLEKGSIAEVTHKEEIIGIALRSKLKTNPIFISPGHLCDMDTALKLTLNTIKIHKLPEPTRIADKYSKILKFG